MRLSRRYNPNGKGPIVMVPETIGEWNALMQFQTDLGCDIKFEKSGMGMRETVQASFPSIKDPDQSVNSLKKEIAELTRQRDSDRNEFKRDVVRMTKEKNILLAQLHEWEKPEKKDVAQLRKENKTLENVAESYITRNEVTQKEMIKRGQQYEAELEMVRKQRDEFAAKVKKMESEMNAY